MPEFHLTDSIITQLNAQEPWPDNVKLFQPYEVEQILLPDNASCLAVQAFLKMCNLPFEVEMRWNAEFMSPSGRVPFIKCGAFVVSELDSIVQFAANKGVSLCGRLSTEEKAEMRAYMSLITNVLVNAENKESVVLGPGLDEPMELSDSMLYISWVDNETFNAVTKVRNSSVYPWPLGWFQTRAKRNAVIKRLKALHWYDKTLDQVLADVEQCCNSLSQRLGDKDYFFGTAPTPLDALVYGHMRAILMGGGMRAGAGALIKRITSSLLRLVLRCINLTKMVLTPQEEYLVTQAFQISRRRLSPERTLSERSTRMQRSRMSMRNPSKDNVNNYNNRDVFGFKPFASKQIIIMTSKEGTVTCQYPGQTDNGDIIIDPEVYNSIFTIVEEILRKVNDLIIDEFVEKVDLDNEKNDPFEVIPFPNESKYISIEAKVSEYLDTIEENDMTETSNSLELCDDMLIVNDDDTDNDLHELNDDNVKELPEKSASQKTLVGVASNVSLQRRSVIELNSKEIIINTDNIELEQEIRNESVESNSDKQSFIVRASSPATTDSSSTLKTPQSEEISVEKLLRPTELDALVFGHVFTIITTRLPCRKLAETVRKHESLVALAKRVDEQYFKRP